MSALAERRSTTLPASLLEACVFGGGPADANKYLHARYYDPALGTFLSPDPMHPAEPGVGLNRYSYGFGNPVNGSDRSGLIWIVCSRLENFWTCEQDGAPAPRDPFRGREGPSDPNRGFNPGNGRDQPDENPNGCAASAGGCAPPPAPAPTPTPKPKPANPCEPGKTPTGAVLQSGVQGEVGGPQLGVVPAGAMAQGSYGIAIARDVSVFASGGVNIGFHDGPGVTSPTPSRSRGFAVGASVGGGGLQLGLTNTPSSERLRGPFTTYNLNTPFFSGQFALGEPAGGTPVYVASLGGPAIGLSFSKYATSTTVMTIVEGKCK